MKQLVYLVDDDEDDCYLAKATLSPQANCEIIIFDDGLALLTYLRQHPQAERPTLILLDLNMPRLNGFETLTALKQDAVWQQIPVVVLTTSDHMDDRLRCMDLGAEGFLTKPADFTSLSEVLASVSSCWRSVLTTE